MTSRYQIFDTFDNLVSSCLQIVHKKYLSSPWAQVKPKDFKITDQVKTNFPVRKGNKVTTKVKQCK
jgi:hypothetical protein